MRSVFILLMAAITSTSIADPATRSHSSFDKLQTLVGKWKKEGSDGETSYISFESSANGSVLIENWIYKDKSHSITVYHPDGKSLLATHYCPQGNQPRLRLEEGVDKENTLSFVFQDATNLQSLQSNHQHALSFEFIDENTILRKESYRKAGEVTPSTLRLVRK